MKRSFAAVLRAKLRHSKFGQDCIDTNGGVTGIRISPGYALFSGLIFIAIMGIVLAPVTHRMLHKFHVDRDDLQN